MRSSDFTGSDIRGLSFRGHDLRGVCFAGAQAGLRPRTKVLLLLGSLFAAGLAALIIGYAATLPSLYTVVEASARTQLTVIFEGFALLFILTTLWKAGPGKSLGITLMLLSIFTAVVAFSANGDDSSVVAILFTAFNLCALAGILLASLSLILVRSLLHTRWYWIWPMALAIPLMVAGLREGIMLSKTDTAILTLYHWSLQCLLVFVFSIVTIVITDQATRGIEGFMSLVLLSKALICSFGTDFRGAFLDRADFTKADLRHCDFRGASLMRTRWREALFLADSRLEDTYLANPSIRELLASNSATSNVFDGLIMRDLNLDGADLSGSSFVGSDLSGCTFREALMVGCCLAKSRMYGVNLQLADLSKACIDNWAISTDTIFDGVVCREIYLRLPNRDDPDPWRKPDNRDEYFMPGDFQDFVAPMIRTLGLYRSPSLDIGALGRSMRTLDICLHESVNPTAIMVAMHQLAIANPDAMMQLVAVSGQGKEKVRLQTVLSDLANNSTLSHQFHNLYNAASVQPLEHLKGSLEKFGDQVKRIESLLEAAQSSQTNYYISAHDISGVVNFGNIDGDIINRA